MSQVLIDDLKERIAGGQAIAIVGAGVSMGATDNAPVASWVGLLKDGIARCEAVARPPAGWADRYRAALDSGDLDELLGVAEQVSRRLGYPQGGEWRRWLRETVGQLKSTENATLEALRDLGVAIATTNYDSLIEEITRWPAFTWREGPQVERVLRGDDEGVLHLHGHWQDPESVVLGIRSYDAVLGDAHAQTVLRSLRLRHTLVFVGCGAGLSDPNLGALLVWSRPILAGSEYRHFRLCRASESEELERQHPREERIFPLPFGEKHEDLAPFLRGLAPRQGSKKLGKGPPQTDVVALPAKPARCIGRDKEVETLVGALLAGEPTPVLGPAGIGKSTVCLQALHDQRLAEHFGGCRYFVRLDGAHTAKDTLAGVGAVLGIAADQASIASLIGRLDGQPAALALDNLETPWEAETLETEALLGGLVAVPGLALTVTLRSGNRPDGVAWRDAIEVEPLDHEDAKRVFLAVAGNKHAADVHLDALLTALDGVPLAIKLMAHAAEAEPDLAGIRQRWQTERTEMLKRGAGDDRLINIGASLELSIKSPRMTDPARRLLSLLGVLPDGIARTDLETLLPGLGNTAAATLRQVALAFDEAGRLRTLAPVREHVAVHHPPAPEDLGRAIDHYSGLAKELGPKCGAEGGAEAVARLSAETANIENMLLLGLQRAEPGSVVEAAVDFAEFQSFSGLGTLGPLDQAVLISKSVDDFHAAQAVFRRGRLALARSDHDGARERYEAALPLYRRVGAVLGEANCIKGLGDIALRRSDHDGARERYEAALPLYRRVGDVLGEANCIKGLGDIALRRSDHDGARERYEAALPLYRRVGDVLGEANCIKGLGDIALRRSDHDGARERYEAALPLYRRVGAVRGEANCILRLGDIALARSDHDGARERYEAALPLYRRVGAVLGEANCIKRLGDIALARSDHAGAGERYAAALPLYRRVGAVLGEANCIQSLGDVTRERSDHDGARRLFDDALALYARIPEPYSIGWTHRRLADVARDEDERVRHIAAARDAWLSIGREDLVQQWLDQTGASAG